MKKAIFLAVSATLLVAASARATQAFHGVKRSGEKLVTHWRSKEKGYGSRYHRRYGASFELGFPYSCSELKKRAYLTDNAYWHYAYDRCRFSYYTYH